MNDDIDDCGPHASLDFWGENLDPDPILAVIPLQSSKPKRKGYPLGPARGGKVPVAKFGTCHFFTTNILSDRDPSAHVRYLLEAVKPRISEIRSIKESQGIGWRITLFEGDRENEKLKDVDPDLLETARELGIPVEAIKA